MEKFVAQTWFSSHATFGHLLPIRWKGFTVLFLFSIINLFTHLFQMHLRRNPQGSSRLFSAKTAQKNVLSKARHSNSWAGKQETDKVYLPINRPGKTPIVFFYLKKGSLISEGILTLVPLPKKGAKSCPRKLDNKRDLIRIFCPGARFGNGTKVRIAAEIKQPLFKRFYNGTKQIKSRLTFSWNIYRFRKNSLPLK